MINVFFILVLSLSSPLIVSSDVFEGYIYESGYVIYSSAIAIIYLVFALIGSRLAKLELNKSNNFNAILIGSLSICMVVTACFNLAMIDKVTYQSLLEIKSGPGLSWSSIYTSIEILIAFIVGANGLNYLAHMGGFTDCRVKTPVNPDLDHWTGKYK